MKKTALPLVLYALTIFLSAFLLFQVQPIIAKIILPWFGGSAAVWTTCLLFFQIVLLLGYLYAHGSIRYLPSFWQKRVHVGLLIVSALFALHIIPSVGLKPHGGDEPTARILLVLLLTIGLPYFLLSTTSPLLQAWYDAHVRADAGAEESAKTFPYRLYALSNAGSLLALLSYPILIEPRFALRQQALVWQTGYFCFAVLCSIVALRTRGAAENTSGRSLERSLENSPPAPQGGIEEEGRRGEAETSHNRPASIDNRQSPIGNPERLNARTPEHPTPYLYLLWIFLAFCSSTLLLAISNHLSQNVAAIPFLWVLPLSLYLLSFIWCFGGKEWQWKRAFLPLPLALLAAMTYALSDEYQNLTIKLLIPLFAGGLFVCCVLCHGELARLKPNARHLTAFYLMISIGGALGGIFVGLLAPRWFHAEYELPIALGLCAVIALFTLYREQERNWWIEPSWLCLMGLTILLLWFLRANVLQWDKEYSLTVRNFYGVLRVSEPKDKDADDAKRMLTYGTIQHGSQYIKPSRRQEHISYYGADTGLGLAIRTRNTSNPERVGVIGLGTGSIASYARSGDVYRYYEINPLVLELAQSKFTYLGDCKARNAQIDVVMGDARLSLEAEPSQQFDVLAVDAFSSDAIPVHLLTKEAFDLYFRHLKPDGILAVHVSNRYLNLVPVVASLADVIGKEAELVSTDADSDHDLATTEWVLVTAQHSFFKTPLLKNTATEIKRDTSLRPWTDDYSNLFQALKQDKGE